jgi:hypothetical protein
VEEESREGSNPAPAYSSQELEAGWRLLQDWIGYRFVAGKVASSAMAVYYGA